MVWIFGVLKDGDSIKYLSIRTGGGYCIIKLHVKCFKRPSGSESYAGTSMRNLLDILCYKRHLAKKSTNPIPNNKKLRSKPL